eukprot:3066594-Pleurochrysis_carterae.AAC.1
MTSPRRTHPPRLPRPWRPGVSAALPATTRQRTTSSTSSSVPRTRLAFLATGGSSMSASGAPTITPTWPFHRTRNRRSSSALSASTGGTLTSSTRCTARFLSHVLLTHSSTFRRPLRAHALLLQLTVETAATRR